jgi:hypothetical protein
VRFEQWQAVKSNNLDDWVHCFDLKCQRTSAASHIEHAHSRPGTRLFDQCAFPLAFA